MLLSELNISNLPKYGFKKCLYCKEYIPVKNLRDKWRKKYCSRKCSALAKLENIRKKQKSIKKIPLTVQRGYTFQAKKCVKCKQQYDPINSNQKYCFSCRKHRCKNSQCGRIVSCINTYCPSCKQLGERNNTKQINVRRKLSIAGTKRLGRKLPKQSELTKRIRSIKFKGSNNPAWGKVTYGTGRCKWFNYFSPIAGQVLLQGTYELRMAKCLDKMDVYWEKNKEGFIYLTKDNEKHTYIPDFKIKDGEKEYFIETKGWFPVEDQYKMAAVREIYALPIIVVDKMLLDIYENSLGIVQ